MDEDAPKRPQGFAATLEQIAGDAGWRPIERAPRRPQGFAAMTPERRTELARQGGAAVPAEKRSYSLDHELAARAGAAGGRKSRGGGRPRKAPQ